MTSSVIPFRYVVYVAGPISKGDLADNIFRAHNAGIALMKAGLAPWVPHGSCFWGNSVLRQIDEPHLSMPPTTYFLPEAKPAGTTHEDWMDIDLEFVRRSDAVLRLRGDSVGADREVEYAVQCGIPVFTSVEEVVGYFDALKKEKK